MQASARQDLQVDKLGALRTQVEPNMIVDQSPTLGGLLMDSGYGVCCDTVPRRIASWWIEQRFGQSDNPHI